MRKFPSEFEDIHSPIGKGILKRGYQRNQTLGRARFLFVPGVIEKRYREGLRSLLDRRLYAHLSRMSSPIPTDLIRRMKESYGETLPKTVRVRTAYLKSRRSVSSQIAHEIGLVEMMASESLHAFAQAVTGWKLERSWEKQAICYGPGDYSGPHNDHHPDVPEAKNGFIDLHIMFSSPEVRHQLLVYETNHHFSGVQDVSRDGAVAVYSLPFWHFTTPLTAKRETSAPARRWLLLASLFESP